MAVIVYAEVYPVASLPGDLCAKVQAVFEDRMKTLPECHPIRDFRVYTPKTRSKHCEVALQVYYELDSTDEEVESYSELICLLNSMLHDPELAEGVLKGFSVGSLCDAPPAGPEYVRGDLEFDVE